MKLKIACEVKIGENWVHRDNMSAEEFAHIIEEILNQAMGNIGFDRIKTA